MILIGGYIFNGMAELRIVGGMKFVRLLRERLTSMAMTLSDFKEPLSQAKDDLREEIASNFATQGMGRWPKLSPATEDMRTRPFGGRYRGHAPMRAGPTGPILRWTGRLKLAAMGGGGTTGQDGYTTIRSHELIMGAHGNKGNRTPGYYGNLHDLAKGGMLLRRIYNMPAWAGVVEAQFWKWIDKEITIPWARGV